MTQENATYLKRERFVVVSYLLCVMVLLVHFIHEHWEGYFASEVGDRLAHPDRYVRMFAPDVYRVAIPALLRGLMHLPLLHAKTSAITCSDFVFGSIALYLGYCLTVHGVSAAPPARAARIVQVAFYLAALLFPMFWVLPYARPETLPTACFLTLAMLLLVSLRQSMLRIVPILLLTIFQGFTRSDVAFFFGAAIFLIALLSDGLRDFAPRRVMIPLGAAIAGIAGSIQVYLQFVRFPHTPYTPGTPVFMLLMNLKPHYLVTVSIAMLPVALVLFSACVMRRHLQSTDLLAMTVACLFFPLWVTVGLVTEVRIFVPFMVLLAPTASRLVVSYLELRGFANA